MSVWVEWYSWEYHCPTKSATGYILRDPDKNEVESCGKAAMGARWYSKKYLRENNVEMVEEALGSKKYMHTWQNRKMLEYKAAKGCR
ncbi:hypothetical protein ACIPM0_14510 [Pseudomonas sichuanensis]|uniref:hypothetical protein n=1 Tax=Pseudomonas TaxID=286 RepID=UPI0037F50DA3